MFDSTILIPVLIGAMPRSIAIQGRVLRGIGRGTEDSLERHVPRVLFRERHGGQLGVADSCLPFLRSPAHSGRSEGTH